MKTQKILSKNKNLKMETKKILDILETKYQIKLSATDLPWIYIDSKANNSDSDLFICLEGNWLTRADVYIWDIKNKVETLYFWYRQVKRFDSNKMWELKISYKDLVNKIWEKNICLYNSKSDVWEKIDLEIFLEDENKNQIAIWNWKNWPNYNLWVNKDEMDYKISLENINYFSIFYSSQTALDLFLEQYEIEDSNIY